MAALAHDFDFAPSDVAIPSGAERLHRRLFRGEATGVALIARISARLAICYFAVGEHACAKPCPGQRTIDRPLDAIDLDQIDSSSENSRHRGIEQSMIRVPTQPPHVSRVLAARAAPILWLIQSLTKLRESLEAPDGEAQHYRE